MSNIKNRTVYCNDNLNILKGINNNTIDLIYLDPPFNSGKDYTGAQKSMAEQVAFKDTWDEDDMNIEWWYEIKEKHPKLYLFLKNVDDYSKQSNQTYLVMMAVRMLEMHRILKDDGSLYYHCDHSMSHYIKIMLDVVFGLNNFRNNIVWSYDFGGRSKNMFPRKHDDIFFYTKTKKYNFYRDQLDRTPYKGKMHNANDPDKAKGKTPTDVWDIPIINTMAKERCGWPTQKPLQLLERIIKASSKEGDMILDPFCGCATTCVAAEKLNRQWIGIDVWEEAHRIIGQRMERDISSDLFQDRQIHLLSKPPIRTDNDPSPIKLKKRKYVSDEVKEAVYERDNGSCKNCGAKEELQYDHIIPFSKGGNDTIDNLQILCRSCNLTKSNKYHG